MKGHGSKLPRKQEQAIAALLRQPTILKAAEEVGVSEKTLREWMAEPSFARAYRKARAQVVEHAVGVLQQTTGKAVATLYESLSCDSPAARIRAAQVLLEQSVAAVRMSEVLDRLDALEAQRAEGVHRARRAEAAEETGGPAT
jgi:hypothetical protein